ncbi:unnamed protein product [Dibothriocephalus latus]|uniref:Uncharacterized protein n=1 Tax=Dibothriocephalus latus TaxID=60516 RepID=A0A3P7MHF4_DIBLA|nr:unnamed protein product [Dibothriocephalus latus]
MNWDFQYAPSILLLRVHTLFARQDVDSADEDDGMLRILLIHVTESGQKENEEEHDVSDSYRAVGENAGPAPKFRRFSPPLLISVSLELPPRPTLTPSPTLSPPKFARKPPLECICHFYY